MRDQLLKFFFIAGEPSGDIHGGKLIKAIKEVHPNSSFMGLGGNSMINEGMKITHHVDRLSVMGFYEVLKHLPRLLKIMGETINLIREVKPDRIVLIDYPGFNLRLAKNISHLNIPISYFILPQAWAWKKDRVNTMKRFINHSVSIFDFEQQWYQSQGLFVEYVGHPFSEQYHLNEKSEEFYKRHNLNISKPILGLLPGSRQQEVDRHWKIFSKSAKILSQKIPDLQIIVAKSPNIHLNSIPENFKIENDSRKAIIASTAAIVASGTATLECAVENTPMVVCYKLSALSWFFIKRLSNIKYSSIVNLICNKEVVPELLQKNMTVNNIIKNAEPLLELRSSKRKLILDDFISIRKSLGIPGVYKRTAESILLKAYNSVNENTFKS